MNKNSFNRMRELLLSKPVPKVDVKHKVMATVYAKKKQEEKVVKKKIGLLLTVGLLVGASSVWAGMEIVQLKNEKGEVVLEIEKMSEVQQQQLRQQLTPAQKDSISNRSEELMRQLDIGEQIIDGLNPGDAIAIYWPLTKFQLQANPYSKPFIDVRAKPFTYTTLEDMEQKVGHLFKIPVEIGTDFKFTKGKVSYEPSDKYDEEAMKAELINTRKEYVVKPIPLSDKFRNAEVEYQGQKGSAFLDVSILNDEKASVGAIDSIIEKVMIGNNEAVYFHPSSNNEESFHSLQWVKNGTKVRYHLRIQMGVGTKEELIKMAEQINQLK